MPKLPHNQEFTLDGKDHDYREVQICRGGCVCMVDDEHRLARQRAEDGCPNCRRERKWLGPTDETCLPSRDPVTEVIEVPIFDPRKAPKRELVKRDWSEEESAALVNCVNNGLSYADTAAVLQKKFGCHGTRGAVSGMVSRLIESGQLPRMRDCVTWTDKERSIAQELVVSMKGASHAEVERVFHERAGTHRTFDAIYNLKKRSQ